MRLLVVDWDYFFPTVPPKHKNHDLFDWSHSETKAHYLSSIWPIRAAAFLAQGFELPTTSGAELVFWNRFKFSKKAKLYYADANALAYHPDVRKGVTEVMLFDAHHDSGYPGSGQEVQTESGVNSENWTLGYLHHVGATVRVVYPSWKAWALKVEVACPRQVKRQVDRDADLRGTVDRVFVCRSGGWTPPWIDDLFRRFVEGCPVRDRLALDRTATRPRGFNVGKAQAIAASCQRLTKEERLVSRLVQPGTSLIVQENFVHYAHQPTPIRFFVATYRKGNRVEVATGSTRESAVGQAITKRTRI